MFKQADLEEQLAPEDIEMMGEAAWWAARPDEGIEAFQRAYRAYLQAGQKTRAATVALTLAREFGVKLANSVSAGWFNRAKRLLEAEPEGAEHGYLYARQSLQALHHVGMLVGHVRRLADVRFEVVRRQLELLVRALARLAVLHVAQLPFAQPEIQLPRLGRVAAIALRVDTSARRE